MVLTPEFLPFNPQAIPKEKINFLEANAGTGKTSSLITIYNKFLAEGLKPKDILTLSFTNNAVREIKQRLAITNRDEESEIYTFHSFIYQILQQYALESFEPFEAEITKVENENFFKTAFLNFLKIDLAKEDRLFLNYLKEKKIKSNNPLNNYSNSLYENLKELYSRINLIPYPSEEKKKSLTKEKEIYLSIRKALKEMILKNKELLFNDLNKLDLKKNSYPNLGKMFFNFFFEVIEKNPDSPLDLINTFSKKKVLASLKKGVTIKSQLIKNWLDLVERYQKSWNDLESIFQHNYFFYTTKGNKFIEEKIRTLKKNRRILNFDDLIKKMQKLIQDKHNQSFWNNFKNRYQVIIVDEFQDTDEIQLNFIEKILSLNPTLKVYLIGDPKQSIYGFRNANLNMYFKARSLVKKVHTLQRNYRSSKELIEAINYLYGSLKNPFLDERIIFNNSQFREDEGGLGRKASSVQDKFCLKVLNLEKINRSKFVKISKKDLKDKIIEMVVKEIKDLPSSEQNQTALLLPKNEEVAEFKKALSYKGIPLHQEAEEKNSLQIEAKEIVLLMEAMLNPWEEKKIRSLYLTSILGDEIINSSLKKRENKKAYNNIFLQHKKLWQEKGVYVSLLTFMLDPEKNANLNFLSLNGNEKIKHQIKHHSYLRIIEKLHSLEEKTKASPELLLRLFKADNFLAEHLKDEDGSPTLGEGVKILTIHKCKGLEFKRVILPFSSFALNFNNKPVVFFNEDKEGEGKGNYYLDLGSQARENNKALSKRELERENLRLLYVALTRAKKHLSVYYLPQEKSVFNLIHLFDLVKLKQNKYFSVEEISLENKKMNNGSKKQSYPSSPRDYLRKDKLILNTLKKPLTSRGYLTSFSSIKSDINNVDFESKNFYHLNQSLKRNMNWLEKKFDYSPKEFEGENIDFEKADQSDEMDEAPKKTNQLENELPPLSLSPLPMLSLGPTGPKMGIVLHAILENWQPNAAYSVQEKLVEDHLAKEGMKSYYKKPILAFLTQIKQLNLLCPLALSREENLLNLKDRKNKVRKVIGLDFPRLERENKIVKEMEFTLRIKKSKQKTIQSFLSLLNESGYLLDKFIYKTELINPTLTEMEMEDGFLKGFIDLVFEDENKYYFIDWKSNYLGSEAADYSEEKLYLYLLEQNYFLQAFIYTMALDTFLSLKLGRAYRYEEHLGGCFYLFIRGINLLKTKDEKILTGQFGFKFSKKIIQEFKNNFII